MNKAQLIDNLSVHFGGNKRQAQQALDSVLDTVMRGVAAGEKVSITGFGAFVRFDRPSRMVRNPRTGERKRAKKTSIPKFRAGAEFKAVVSGTKKLPKLAAGTARAKAIKPASSVAAAPAKATARKATAKTTARTPRAAATTAPAPAARKTARAATPRVTSRVTPPATAKTAKTARATPRKTTTRRTGSS